MSTGYSWEGIRQVRATLLGARHVPERLCGCLCVLGALYQVLDLYLLPCTPWIVAEEVREIETRLIRLSTVLYGVGYKLRVGHDSAFPVCVSLCLSLSLRI